MAAFLPLQLALVTAALVNPNVRVEVLGLLHPHRATISAGHRELNVRAVGDRLHFGVGPERVLLRIESPAANEPPVSIKIDKLARRRFAGALELRAHAGELEIINEVPLEEYVASVVGAEMPRAPLEAQKALSIVARSFALNTIQRSAGGANPGAHDSAPLCDQTHCQLYLGLASSSKSARAATAATQGVGLLLPSGHVAATQHHAACGGHTATARELWLHASDDEELASASVDDHLPSGAAACAAGPGDPPLEWQAEIDATALAHALGAASPLSVALERAPEGWVRTLSFNGHFVGADELHLLLGRALGWNRIRSSRIFWSDANVASEASDDSAKSTTAQVHATPRRVVLRGLGFGHGVGLCQRGASRWARAGETYERILAHYFPKLTVGRLPLTPIPG